MHKIELKTKSKNQLTTGANCELLIDGKPIKYAKSFKLEVDAAGVAKATIEVYGSFAANVIGDFDLKVFQVGEGDEDDSK